MQSSKARVGSSGTPQKNNSPRSAEASQKNTNTTTPPPKPATTSEIAHRVSPRVVGQLKTGPRYLDHTAASASLATKPPKERSPKVADHKSPKSTASGRKGASRVSELENQVSQLENDLKIMKDQLRSTEELKERAEKDAEQSRQELSSLQKHLSDNTPTDLDELETHTAVQPEPETEAHTNNQENELDELRQNLSETLSLVEDMKTQLTDCKASEMQALTQLEAAKRTADPLLSDEHRNAETHDALAPELSKSLARVDFLEKLVHKLEADAIEVERLKSAEARHTEERARVEDETQEFLIAAEKARSKWAQREVELESELQKSMYEVEELRANLMDKETELQGILEENEGLELRLESSVSGQGKSSLRRLLEQMREEAEEQTARLAEKEAECQALSKENERLRLEVKEDKGNVVEEIEAARREAAAAAAAREEMEAEVRRMKVQSDQWRKAAEVAAAMISAGNNNDTNNNGLVMERTGSMDSHYRSPRMGKVGSPYTDDLDDDSMKKKNKMRRLGSLWKKQQK